MIETGDTLLDRLGRWLAGRLQEESSGYEPYTPSDAETLRRTLEPGDILLIEGNQKISAAIKYLTQSTWSHAAFYVGDALPEPADGSERRRLIEVTLG
ncbi:lipo-like protein, partial [Mesorhizobium sp. M6A.T.Ca.TU.002.02.2.1]